MGFLVGTGVHNGFRCIEDDLSLTLEIVGTIVTVIDFLSAGEPALSFPNITFFLQCFYDSHPPVKAKNNHKADHPLNENPYPINPAK